MTRAQAIILLRRARASLDAVLALTGDEDPDFQEAALEEAEAVATDLHLALQLPPDPGGPRVWSCIPDWLAGETLDVVRQRLTMMEQETGAPVRANTTSYSNVRECVIDAAIYSFALNDHVGARLLLAVYDSIVWFESKQPKRGE